MTDVGFEIEFFPVGTGSKSGDAILIRYGRLYDTFDFYQRIIVIDGGTMESGEKLVEHIKTIYKTETVDLVINTHPDNDHCSGLRQILNELIVKELWLHTPWNYSQEFIELFKDGRITSNSLKEKLKEGLNIAHELEQIAKGKNITIREPFEGLQFDSGVVTILGPTKEFYNELIAKFRSTPEPVESALSKAYSNIKESISMLFENLLIETLEENGETSSENNSSVICLLNFANQKILMTADAGIPALNNAINYCDKNYIPLNDLNAIQVPHHGSKRNISPSILNKIYGKVAQISCAKNGEPKHPAKKVTNAFNRRKMTVYANRGVKLRHSHNAPFRNYTSAIPIPFYNQVEE